MYIFLVEETYVRLRCVRCLPLPVAVAAAVVWVPRSAAVGIPLLQLQWDGAICDTGRGIVFQC